MNKSIEKIMHLRVVPNKKMVELEHLKALTGDIKFDCDFDCGGFCKKTRRMHKEYGAPKEEKNCCAGCETSGGFFHHNNVVTQDQKDFLIANFNGETGFWRKKKGCIVPRKWRSKICTSYTCRDTIRGMENTDDHNLLETIRKYPVR